MVQADKAQLHSMISVWRHESQTAGHLDWSALTRITGPGNQEMAKAAQACELGAIKATGSVSTILGVMAGHVENFLSDIDGRDDEIAAQLSRLGQRK